jgi:hypothetical protein
MDPEPHVHSALIAGKVSKGCLLLREISGLPTGTSGINVPGDLAVATNSRQIMPRAGRPNRRGWQNQLLRFEKR